ncbi:MAG: dipeptidase [Caldilineaceae bacterium]|nr:dipeptidase [Caldilineaceae bacterium]
MSTPLIFDGHNDTILRLFRNDSTADSFFQEGEVGHIDLPRAQAGGLGGGFFALFVPNPRKSEIDSPFPGAGMSDAVARYEIPLPPALEYSYALNYVMGMMATLFRIEDRANGAAKIVRTADELAACLANGTLAMILHFEGAEAIDEDLNALRVFYAAGLRSLGLVWSRPTIFAHGVPFAFPATPDIGPGLTDAGKRLVAACNDLGIMLDLSHLNEKGFWDVAELSDAPLVATHSGVHAICPTPRNLTDAQLDAIAQSGGVAGVNFHTGFLRADGRADQETSLAEIVHHVDYMVERMGIDHVALGSDFDGATMPQDLKDAAGLPKLVEALQDRGYTGDDLTKIAHGNWVRVLRQTWK